MGMMKDTILKSQTINMDETTVQVLNGPRKSKSYMWVFKAGPKDKSIILFQYHPTRSGDVASIFLNGYKRIVQTDGYAWTALNYISKLYNIEKEARQKELSSDQLYTQRQSRAFPVLEEFKKWLDATVEKVPPKNLVGKAVHYTLNQWPRLIRNK